MPTRSLPVAVPVAALLLLAITGCARQTNSGGAADFTDRKMEVVVTTNIIGDLVRQLAGDEVALTTLMGPGVDPHLYRASEGDVQTMASADLVLYNGLHLEGKMTDVFSQMNKR
jgi:manganese/zinc/iron transport system substrate-binding protein